jgi:hypothetical protein
MITLDDIKKTTEAVVMKLTSMGVNIHEQIYGYKCFVQTWSSTALGFGGWGGSSMTSAITTIVYRDEIKEHIPIFYVFFGGSFAYAIKNPNQKFFEDMEREDMAEVSEAYEKYNSE